MVIDATSLKVYGAGEWLVAKHGALGMRTWRKLHLAVDPSIGEILASKLTSDEDGELVYRTVAERQLDPPVAVVIPPRSTAVPSPDAAITPKQRDQHIRMIQTQRTSGLAEGGQLRPAVARGNAHVPLQGHHRPQPPRPDTTGSED